MVSDGAAVQRRVGPDHLHVPVGVRHLELGDQPEPVAVQRPAAEEAEPSAPPAVAERDREHALPVSVAEQGE